MIYFTPEQIEDGTTSYCGIDYVEDQLRKELNLMPYAVERRGSKFRLIHAAGPDKGDVAMNAAGTPMDGGGHATRAEAESQQRAVEWRENGGKKT